MKAVWNAIPCKLLWLFVAVCGVAREAYPFSHFPMYSNFEPYTYYVYVTDGSGRPVALHTDFGIRTSNLKKIYDRELRRLARGRPRGTKSLTAAEREPAGRYALEFLRENSGDRPRTDSILGLRLVQVDIRMEKGHIVKTETPIAAIGEAQP